jgi:hypothetical protein
MFVSTLKINIMKVLALLNYQNGILLDVVNIKGFLFGDWVERSFNENAEMMSMLDDIEADQGYETTFNDGLYEISADNGIITIKGEIYIIE